MIRILSRQRRPVSAEQILEALFGLSAEAVLIIDPADFSIVRGNAAAGGLLGASPEELQGTSFSTLLIDEASFGRFRETCERDLGPGRVLHLDQQARVSGGQVAWIAHTLTRVAGDHGPEIIVDVLRPASTEAARLGSHDPEVAARLARMGALGELAAGIAHEVSQPLTAVLNYMSALRRLIEGGSGAGERAAQILESAHIQARRAAEIVHRLNAFLRGKGPTREVVCVNEAVRHAAQLVSPEAGLSRVDIELALQEGLAPLWADHIQLQQVIVNLMKNSVDAVRAMPADARRVVVSTRRANHEMIAVSVQDRGPGVSQADMARLFDPFFSTKPEGLGMGLSISRSIVSAHGGSLWAVRGAEGGMTFQFTIPVYRPEANDSGTDYTRCR